MLWWICIVITLLLCHWPATNSKRTIKLLRKDVVPTCDLSYDCHDFVDLPAEFPVGKSKHKIALLNTNGYIVLFPEKPTHLYIPDKPTLTNLDIDKPLLAPFWTSITSDDHDVIGNVRVDEYIGKFRGVADKLIRKKYRSKFASKKTVAFHWKKIECMSSKTGEYQTNNFYVYLTTDFKSTFVTYYYVDLSWYRCRNRGDRGSYAMAGINFGNGTTISLPYSGSSKILRIAKRSNVPDDSKKPPPGVHIYRLAGGARRCKAALRDIYPTQASLFGGTPVTITGDCFKSKVSCRFDKSVVAAAVIKRKKIVCVTPKFARVGTIPLSVSVDGGRFMNAPDFRIVDGDKISVDEDKMSVELRSSGQAKWGELVAPLGEISWPKSYFNTRLVDIVYMMHKQSSSDDDHQFVLIPLKKGVENTGSMSLNDINLADQTTLRPGFIGALGIQEHRDNSAETPVSAPLALWSVIHPARWYYNMYAKESIRRAHYLVNDKVTAKSKFIRAAVVLAEWPIEKIKIPLRALVRYFSKHARELNKLFFKDTCDEWVVRELDDTLSTDYLPACPCNINIAKKDSRFRKDVTTFLGRKNNASCIRTILGGGGDQQCCYGGKGQLLSFAEGGGSVSRFSATRQPIQYMLQDYWPKIMCGQLADDAFIYQELRRTDDCSEYELPV